MDANDYDAILTVIEDLRKKKIYSYPQKTACSEENAETKEITTIKDAITEMNKSFNSLSKKVETLENIPVRISQTTSAPDVDAEVKKFASELSAGEMLVYAEKNRIKWGDKGE